MNSYFIMAAVCLILGFGAGWYVTKDHYEAAEASQLDADIKAYKISQDKIQKIDNIEQNQQEDLKDENSKLKEKLRVAETKKHTVCQHTANMRRVLYQASLPPANLSH